MKILQVTSSFYPVVGGQEKVVLETSKELVKKGHKVTILTTDLFCEDENLSSREIIEGINVIRLKNKFSLMGYGFSPGIIKWLKENWKNYDLVHSHGYNRFLSEYALFYLRNKIPIFFSAHGFVHTKKNYIFKKLHDATLGKVVRYATKCTALTKLDYAVYSKLGVSNKKIIDLPNGVDMEKYTSPDKRLINSLKRKFDLRGNTLLYTGRIHKSKGLDRVIKAIRILECKLLIVGQDAGYKKYLINLSKKLGVEDKIIFTGCLSEEEFVAAYYASDIFVLFSRWEGFGIVVIEAMAAGKPVIVSDRGALPFIVNDGDEGFVVPFENIGLLEKKIDFLLSNPKKRKAFGMKGKKKAKNYSWKNIVGRLDMAYKEL